MANRKDFIAGIVHPDNIEDKVVIIDADTLLYYASWTGKDEEGNKKPEYTEEEYPIAVDVLNNTLLDIYSCIEEYYNITDVYICVKGKNNFRKEIYEDYKANRPPSLPIIDYLLQHLVDNHNAIVSDGYESDDVVYTLSKKMDHKAIICCVDRDLYQIPSLFFDYKKKTWKIVTEEEAKYHLACKVMTGDSGDNVNLSPGIGEKYALKNLQIGMTDYQYIKTIFKGYLKAWKGDAKKAKESMKLTYKLLKLHEVI